MAVTCNFCTEDYLRAAGLDPFLRKGKTLCRSDGEESSCTSSLCSKGRDCRKRKRRFLTGLGVDEIGSLLSRFWTPWIEKLRLRDLGRGEGENFGLERLGV